MKKSSKTVTTVILLASLAPFLAACNDEEENAGMKFESYEECSLNIGPENCQKAPVQQAATGTTQSSGGGNTSHSTFMPIFLPMPGYHGGYLESAPRAQPTYAPKSPAFAASPTQVRSSPSFTGGARPATSFSSSVARGGFGSTSSSFSAAS